MKKLLKIKKTIYKKEITEYTESTILKIKDLIQKSKSKNPNPKIQIKKLKYKIKF